MSCLSLVQTSSVCNRSSSKLLRTLLNPSTYRKMPWKNGGGVTEEIVIHPASATVTNTFGYRLSTARVETGGPFSLFPGYDRLLVVLSGAGLRLGERTLEALEPFAFSGDEPLSAALVAGPIVDFNVIFDRARFKAECNVLQLEALHHVEANALPQFIFCVSGGFKVEGADVGERATLVVEHHSALLKRSVPHTKVLQVRLTSR